MTLRASLEAVLRKHAFFPLSKLRQTEQPSAYFVPSIDTLLDDLLAMFPHPSREALEQLLLQRDIVDREGKLARSSIPVNNPRNVVSRHGLIKAIMAWTTSQQERRWCPDSCGYIRWRDGQWRTYLTPSGVEDDVVLDRWKQCPVCLASRPTEDA